MTSPVSLYPGISRFQHRRAQQPRFRQTGEPQRVVHYLENGSAVLSQGPILARALHQIPEIVEGMVKKINQIPGTGALDYKVVLDFWLSSNGQTHEDIVDTIYLILVKRQKRKPSVILISFDKPKNSQGSVKMELQTSLRADAPTWEYLRQHPDYFAEEFTRLAAVLPGYQDAEGKDYTDPY